MVSPLLVSFGTGMVKRYNQRKKAASAAEYDQILLDDEQAHEMEKLTESRSHDYMLADYKFGQDMSVKTMENQWAIDNKLAEFNQETDRDKQIAIQKQIDDLAMQKDLYERKESLERLKDTFASASNAVAAANGYEVFGTSQSSFKLNQYIDANNNPKVGPEWDRKKMEDLNEAWAIDGFKDIVLGLPDSELQRFQTYATQLFSKYRVSNASKADTGEFLAWARIKKNKQGKGAFQNLFDEEKYPAELGLNEAYEDSTNYMRSLTFQEAKKRNKNITNAFTKESEDGLYDYILTLDDITKLYPGVPMDDVMALAEITKAYNPELHQPGTSGIEAQLEVIYNLQDRPQDLLAVKHANAFATTGRMSDGNKLVEFWNNNPEAYGTSDGYETLQSTGEKIYVGINHEARLESLSLGVVPVLTDNSDPSFVSVLDSSKVDEAQKRIVASSGPMIADIKNVGQQGTTTLDLIRNILTTYEPSYGGTPFTGGALDLLVLLEGFTAQVELLPQTFGANQANSILQQIYTDNKLGQAARESLSTFELDGKKYNIADHVNSMDKRLQVAAQRKFFATALNYTVSMILQGGTGGKTISDTDYEIMDRAMYNGLFTSQGLNLAALEAIYKTIELPIILAQYKTDLSNPNAIQNMQAAMMYERLTQFNGKKQYFELRNRLMNYAEPTVQVSVKKEDYFNGRAHLGKYTPGVTPTKEKTEDGKNIIYFNYFKGGDKATRMPMKLEDVEKYWPRLYEGVKADYADFDNPVFDTYKTYFQENENLDSNNIVKENWNLLGGLVDDDKTPDVTE